MSVSTPEPSSSPQVNYPGNATAGIGGDEAAHLLSFPLDRHVVIEPRSGWSLVDIRELWQYRELLYFLIWKDVKVRYKQAVFGIAWVVVQPLVLTVTFTLFLGKLAKVPSSGGPYALFALSGLVIWTFFSSALTSSSISLTSNSHLITKVYFPRAIIPLAAIGARFIDFAISFIILVGLVIYYRIPITRSILLLPVPLAVAFVLVTGFGLLLSAINVKYRDIGVAIPLLIQVWMFLSPIVYPVSLVPDRFRIFYAFNPLVGIIETFRGAILSQAWDGSALAIASAISLAILLISVSVFRKMEAVFADNV